MDRKSICSLLCAMMLAILLISCNDKDDYDGLSPAELSGTYSNKLSAPANGDSLILSYNGNTFIGKDVEFKTDDGKTAHIILKYVLPHDKETAISGVSLTAGSGSYSFSGGATTSTGTAFHYLGSIQTGKLILELSDITIPENQLTMNGTWYVAHENASYYNVDNGSMQTMIGMLYNLVGGKLVCNLISSGLPGGRKHHRPLCSPARLGPDRKSDRQLHQTSGKRLERFTSQPGDLLCERQYILICNPADRHDHPPSDDKQTDESQLWG